MRLLLIACCIAIIWTSGSCSVLHGHESSLKLLHVVTKKQWFSNKIITKKKIFRHGNRTPNGPEELYPNDPYLNETYFPLGLGQLTNVEKSILKKPKLNLIEIFRLAS